GTLLLQALDFGGHEVGQAIVKVRARKEAMPLPEAEVEAGPVEVAAAEPEASLKPDASAEGAAEEPASPRQPVGEETLTLEELEPGASLEAPEVKSFSPAGDRLDNEVEIVLKPFELRDPAPSGKDLATITKPEPRPEAAAEPREHRTGARSERQGRKSRPEARQAPTTDLPDIQPAPAAALSNIPEERKKGSPWPIFLAGAGVIVIVQVIVLIRARKRRAPPDAPDAPDAESPIDLMADSRFDAASRALEDLAALAKERVPLLLEALDDKRRTPFLKIRRTPRGLTSVPSEGRSGIPVRHIAALLLERAIGKPPVERPSRAQWEAHWDAVRKNEDR
ncbi:MAG TPA: hypothetical protein VMT52_11725, partial [Planctomycetota bacterium]|nr:hypothetical protein [Planctomycetota bacterium]